ncbi:glycosyltransferase family 2 protein [Pontiella sulfatireligans]|uniref:Cellulose synthase catalytic subunit [UDP-forming] n=1 Tax=Pontiella sulfatireligans TaxID=2750658 RepID=A0A6C2UPZ9_9BACT|nr:glycosyltransferase family 2 protein [Pontiella sulfatireligans]VGO22149.1 Cellulose synthase catalytic subunit [UDP-forming] [Pontiella sulfatireligans]
MGFHTIVKTGFEVALTGAFVLSLGYFIVTAFALALSRLRDKPETIEDESLYPTVTVQIPTYNELAALNCAARCLDFDYPADKLQIMIGDDSNQPELSAQIDEFAVANPRIEISRRGDNAGFKPGNLNVMLPKATGDYLLILDSDFLPKRDFLKRLVVPVIKDPTLAGAQAAWRIINVHDNHSTLMGTGIVNIIHTVILPFLKAATNQCVFCGSGELVKKSYLEEHGGWTAGALTEDVDYSLRVITDGKRIAYVSDLRIRCEVPYTPGDLFRQQMRWAYGVMRAFMAHGKKLFLSRTIQKRTKFAAFLFGSGYVMITLLLLTMILGALNLISGILGVDPASAQTSSYTVGHFVYDTAVNLLLTCGMLVSSIAAGFINGFGFRSIGRLVASSLTIGVICMFFVGRGLITAWLGLPMKWFMLKKAGNDQASAKA